MGLPEDRISEAIRMSWNSETAVDFSQLASFIKSMQQ